MSTFTQIYYHLVFSTKDRERVLLANRSEDLFRYAWGILNNKDCHLYRIGGVEDHVHILTDVHPTIALADLVKDIKTATSSWIKKENVFPGFTHWQDGYGAFTVSHGDKDAVIEYIKNQEEHHKHVSFKDELREFLIKHGVQFDENIWGDFGRDGSALSGPNFITDVFRGFHPRLFTLFASGERRRAPPTSFSIFISSFTKTSTAQWTPAPTRSALDVGCWMLDVSPS